MFFFLQGKFSKYARHIVILCNQVFLKFSAVKREKTSSLADFHARLRTRIRRQNMQ